MVWQGLGSSKTLQLLLYSTSGALMKYQDFIFQLPSFFTGYKMGKALNKRQPDFFRQFNLLVESFLKSLSVKDMFIDILQSL